MKFDIKKAVNMINSITSPKAAIGQSLNLLAKKSPEMAKVLSVAINNGKNPMDEIKKYATEGKFTSEDLAQIKKIYLICKKMGLKKFNVSENLWEQIDDIIKKNQKSVISNNNNFGF